LGILNYQMEQFKKYIQELIEFLNKIEPAWYSIPIDFLHKLLRLIENNEYKIFYEKANSIELWGGAGSLWETEFGMTTEQRKQFDDLLLNFLGELKAKDKIGRNAREVQKMLIRFKNKNQ
jgi:hypothetical protein